MKSILFAFLFLSVFNTACESESKGSRMNVKKSEVSQEQLKALVSYLNRIETFPVEMDQLEKASEVPFKEIFSTDGSIIKYINGLNLQLSIIQVDGKRILNEVSIEADAAVIPVPEMPPGIKINETSYAYLPQYRVAEKLGDGFYRSLSYPDQDEYRKVNGTDGRTNPARWKYQINKERGSFISEEEKEGFKEVTLGLLNAIKENRFEEHLKIFEKNYPKNDVAQHRFFGHSLTLVYFNDKKDGEHFGKHLEKDGLTEYVGLHFYPEQGADFRYAKPFLFDFFGIEHLDALQASQARPYAELKDNGTPNPPPAIEPNMKAQLPDISAAGHRKGGLVYYVDPRFVADGWNFWMPGSYPHDGKTVERYLKKDKYLSNSFEVLFSRKK